jgi:hypothetical protein
MAGALWAARRRLRNNPRVAAKMDRGAHATERLLESLAELANPIERVWWHLREEITRNHRCQSIEELTKLILAWLDERGGFKIEGRMSRLVDLQTRADASAPWHELIHRRLERSNPLCVGAVSAGAGRWEAVFGVVCLPPLHQVLFDLVDVLAGTPSHFVYQVIVKCVQHIIIEMGSPFGLLHQVTQRRCGIDGRGIGARTL